MNMPIAKVTEISSSSSKRFEDAINQGIMRASQTIENIKGVWVKEQSCVVDNGKVKEYRVDMKVTFVLKDTA